MDIPCRWTGKDSAGVVKVGCPMNSHGCPLDRWTGQDSGTTLISEDGMSNGCPVDVHWTGKTIPSGQRILMANLGMSDTSTNRGTYFSKIISKVQQPFTQLG